MTFTKCPSCIVEDYQLPPILMQVQFVHPLIKILKLECFDQLIDVFLLSQFLFQDNRLQFMQATKILETFEQDGNLKAALEKISQFINVKQMFAEKEEWYEKYF
jgi:hypothetical protein